ncbi:MAG: TIGR04222 domain-containing membrane protein [bacterium]
MEQPEIANPFDLPGPEFLKLFCLFSLACFLFAWMLRYVLRQTTQSPTGRIKYNPFELAYLSQGEEGVINIAITLLTRHNIIAFNEKNNSFRIVGELPLKVHGILRKLYDGLRTVRESLLGSIHASLELEVKTIHSRLVHHGLILSTTRQNTIRYAPIALLICVLAVGVIKIIIGISRDRPVGFLIILMVVIAFVFTSFFKKPSMRSSLGDKILEEQKQKNTRLGTIASARSQTLADSDLALSLGLFGFEAISFPDPWWGPLQTVLHPSPSKKESLLFSFLSSGDSSGGCSSGYSSMGSGGCSSGCGGGGGCGGCGGG